MRNVLKLTMAIGVLGMALHAQDEDVVVRIAGKGPKLSAASATINYKAAQVSYAIGNGEIDGFGLATLPISISSKTGQLPAGLQFEVKWDSANVSGWMVSPGPAATNAGKEVNCAAQSPTSVKCVVVGLNSNGILDGIVAQVSLQTIISSQDLSTVTMFGTVSASAGGKSIKSVIVPGGGVISMPALLASISCAEGDIWELLTVSCTAALNKPAPTGGATIELVSDSTLVGVPASITIAAGSTTATFNAIGN